MTNALGHLCSNIMREFGFHTSIIVGGPLVRENGRLAVYTLVFLVLLRRLEANTAPVAMNQVAHPTSSQRSQSSWGHPMSRSSRKSLSNTSGFAVVRCQPAISIDFY